LGLDIIASGKLHKFCAVDTFFRPCGFSWIAELVDEENIEREILERCDFEAAVQEVICRLDSFVAEKRVKKPVGTSVQQVSQIETNTQSEVNAPDVGTTSPGQGKGQGQPVMPKHINKTKLPKLSLPRFSGDPTKWMPFWDSFSSAIDENNDLNDVDKFQYLRSLLEGSTVNVISVYH
jgi:hypothetical protein